MTTDRFRQSFFRSGTDEVSLKCVEVDHPELTEPLRFVADTRPLERDGHVYRAMPDMTIPFPAMRKGEIARLQLVLADVNNERVTLIRSLSGPLSVTVFAVLASEPDVIWGGPFHFKIRKFEKGEDGMLAGDLALEDEVLNEPAVEDCYTPPNFSGLF